jgi:flagellar biosynthesis protein FliP
MDPAREFNPLEVLDQAGQTLPGIGGGSATGSTSGEQGRGLSPLMNVLLVLTVITLAPSILLMCTCFVRMIMVLALLRQAIGAQGLPPAQVTLALSLFMTLVVMTPTIDRVYSEAITPYREGRITSMDELWVKAKQPVRDFMFAQLEATGNWSGLYMMLNLRGVDTSQPERLTRAEVDMVSLVPAFMLSELKVAFVMGFKIYLPFLVIDMVISSLLISMGMMMLPPVMISLPFKLLLFVLVDGWQLIVGGLMKSFAQPEALAFIGSPVIEALPRLAALGGLA